jgi:hypothetical protein
MQNWFLLEFTDNQVTLTVIPSLQNQLFWVAAENSVFIHSFRYQTPKIIYNVVKTALSLSTMHVKHI